MARNDRRSYTTRYPKAYGLRLGVPIHQDIGGPCSACNRENVPGLNMVAEIKGAWRGQGLTRRPAQATFFVCDDCFTYMGYDRRRDAPDVPTVVDDSQADVGYAGGEGDGLVEEECLVCGSPQSDCICGDKEGPDLYVGRRIAPMHCHVFKLTGGRSERLEHKEVHSPDGFEWGYGGSGPADLALSLLCDALDEDDPESVPPWLYQAFKAGIVALLPREKWVLRRDDVRKWAAEHREHGRGGVTEAGVFSAALGTIREAVPIFGSIEEALNAEAR